MRLLRSLAEELSHPLIIKRRLPARFGRVPMFVSTEGGLRYWRWDLGNADPWLLGMAQELVAPGSVVWDVGANMGLFSFAAAAIAGPAGKVLAIEPDSWLVNLLRHSSRLEPAKRAAVEVVPAAVSDQLGLAEFYIARRARSANFLSGNGTSQTGGFRDTQLVMTVTLDWLLDRFPAPNVLKIDVEGAEGCVLQGATRLLAAARPLIVCEASGPDAISVLERLKASGYSVVDAEASDCKRTPLQAPTYNMLAFPSTGPSQS